MFDIPLTYLIPATLLVAIGVLHLWRWLPTNMDCLLLIEDAVGGVTVSADASDEAMP